MDSQLWGVPVVDHLLKKVQGPGLPEERCFSPAYVREVKSCVEQGGLECLSVFLHAPVPSVWADEGALPQVPNLEQLCGPVEPDILFLLAAQVGQVVSDLIPWVP